MSIIGLGILIIPLVWLLYQLVFNDTFRSSLTSLVWRGRLIFVILFGLGFFMVSVVGLQGTLQMIPQAFQLVFQLLYAVFFMVIQFGAMMWFMSRARVYWIMPGESPVNFADYKGNPEVLDRAKEIVEIMKAAKDPKVQKMGINSIPGLLLEGPPGTGKSYLAQVIAGEANVPFAYASAPSLQSAFMGMSAMTIMRLYGKARKYSDDPRYNGCILFLDEIDAIGQKRDGGQGAAGGMMGGMMMGGGSQILNELLTQMDPPPTTRGMLKFTNAIRGFFGRRPVKANKANVLTIGATNRVNMLDDALLRPGRFEQRITVDLPSAEGRQEIFVYYLGKAQHVLTMDDTQRLVRRTQGYTPVAIKKIINQGLINALRDGRDAANLTDVMLAQNVHEFGAPQPIISMPLWEKKRIADHESGHGVAAVILRKQMGVEIATIIRRGGALGLVGSKPIQDLYTQTKEDMLQNLYVCLGSRAVEELKHGMQMTGFSGDLQTATAITLHMIGAVGMGTDMISYASIGMGTSPVVINQAKELTKLSYRLVKEFLNRNMDAVNALSDALIEQGDIDGPEVIRIVRENAKFLPEVPLHEALAELLNEDERARMASFFSEELGEKDARHALPAGHEEHKVEPKKTDSEEPSGD